MPQEAAFSQHGSGQRPHCNLSMAILGERMILQFTQQLPQCRKWYSQMRIHHLASLIITHHSSCSASRWPTTLQTIQVPMQIAARVHRYQKPSTTISERFIRTTAVCVSILPTYTYKEFM